MHIIDRNIDTTSIDEHRALPGIMILWISILQCPELNRSVIVKDLVYRVQLRKCACAVHATLGATRRQRDAGERHSTARRAWRWRRRRRGRRASSTSRNGPTTACRCCREARGSVYRAFNQGNVRRAKARASAYVRYLRTTARTLLSQASLCACCAESGAGARASVPAQ